MVTRVNSPSVRDREAKSFYDISHQRAVSSKPLGAHAKEHPYVRCELEEMAVTKLSEIAQGWNGLAPKEREAGDPLDDLESSSGTITYSSSEIRGSRGDRYLSNAV